MTKSPSSLGYALIALACLSLSACAEPSSNAPNASAPPGETIGGDGSPIVLSPLSAKDIDGAHLSGELACSFAADGIGSILLARGDVASSEPAQGVVKVADYVEPVAAPGGYDGMPKGASFGGKGKTIRIAITGKPAGGGESPPSPATLTYLRADGASRVFPGAWTCGP